MKPVRSKAKRKTKPPRLTANQIRAQANALFLSIGEGAIASDEQGRISRVNSVALQLLGFDESDLLHKPFMQVIQSSEADGSPVDPLERPITQAFITGKTVARKSFYRKKDGEYLAVSVTVSPILLSNEPIGAIEVFRDITEEQEIDRMKSEFISIASHQLRTPLTAIKTYAHLLNNGYAGKLTKPQRDFVQIVLASTEHMNKLIDILLDISKIESGRLNIEPVAVSPKELIKDVLDEFNSLVKEKNIKLEVKLSKLPEEIFVDPVLTKEIYSNLLSNAIKYTPPGGEIVFSLKRTTDSLQLSVKDSGYGIPDSQKERIFGKFFRASNVLALEANGSGLGLYMVKKIAQSMGGDIWFKSKEGVGSTFFFSVPYSQYDIKLRV